MIWTIPMTDSVDNLILNLLEWLGTSPRPYAEVLDAWRTSCPRLPVWEEANDRGYIERQQSPGLGSVRFGVRVRCRAPADVPRSSFPPSLKGAQFGMAGIVPIKCRPVPD